MKDARFKLFTAYGLSLAFTANKTESITTAIMMALFIGSVTFLVAEWAV